MIDFAKITAFRLVRRLAAAQGSTGMYLLFHDDHAQAAVEADLQAELEVQLAITAPVELSSSLLDDKVSSPVRLVRIDRFTPELVASLDTHVVRLERTGAQFLFLASARLAERLLVAAPNFRNRLTEVLQISPEEPTGGGSPS